MEARLLLAHAIGADTAALLRDPRAPLPPGAGARLDDLLRRRAEAREPVALLLGRAGFWSLDLAVSASTLIPRPDSESLVEAALALFPDPAAAIRVLDLGTGTGALLLAVLAERPRATGVGIDRVAAAAALARRNADAAGLGGRALLLAGDWAAALSPAARFDLVLSNPPYVETAAIDGLMPEVAAHEPRSALDGGADGLDAYRALAAALPGLLRPGGRAVIELGQGQGPAASALFAARGLDVLGLRDDLGGVPRALLLGAD